MPTPSTQLDDTVLLQRRGDFISTALRRWRHSEEADRENRLRQLEDVIFYADGKNHWPAHIRAMRVKDERPMVSIDRLTEPVKQAVNEAALSKPQIRIVPVDGGADPETAKIAQGIVRHIEVQSCADVAYATAIERAAIQGRGYIRVGRTWINPQLGLEQELVIDRVRNPFSIYGDPMSQQLDGRDWRWGFVVEDLDREEYQIAYPKSQMASLSAMSSIGDNNPNWLTRDTIRVAEYYYFKVTAEDYVVVANPEGGRPLYMPEAEHTKARLPKESIIRRAPVVRSQLHRALINATEVLEGNADLTEGSVEPGRYIPIVPVVADERVMDNKGRVEQYGLVRPAMEAQRVYDYAVSNMVETSMLAPKNAYVGPVGSFETDKTKWTTSHRRTYAFIEYDPIEDAAGRVMPGPTRPTNEAPIAQTIQMVVQADSDLKSTTRRHEASLGQIGPQESGAALRNRQQQDSLSNSHLTTNLYSSLRQVGKIILGQIPDVYDSDRIMRIVGEDDETSSVRVMPGFAGLGDDDKQSVRRDLPTGVNGVFDLGTAARYDVVVKGGPGYATRRAEAASEITEIIKANPATWPIIGHILVKYMDWPGAQDLSDTLKTAAIRAGAIPPDEIDAMKLPPEVVAKLQQQADQIKQITQQVQQLTQEVQTDQAKQQAKMADTQSRAQTEMFKTQAELMIAAAKNEHQIALVEQRSVNDKHIKLMDAMMAELADTRKASRERAGDLRQAALEPPEPPASPAST